ncbi:MAG: hypothetical protein NC184_07455 [Roseburia sp.]|nr:hypothetical protein [Roseburia sp.]
MSRSKNSIPIKVLSAVCALVMIFVSVFPLLGCSLFFRGNDYEATFTRKNISLAVGESYDLSEIIESNTNSYTLTSSDPDIAKVSGTTLTALKAGNTSVKAETSSSSSVIKVTVTDGESDSLTLETTGETAQTLGRISAISFKPIATGSVADGTIDWYVDGQKSDTLSATETFVYMPTSVGEHTIEAVGGGKRASAVCRIYYAVTATAAYTGALTQQSAPYSDIVFSVSVDRNSENPADFVKWVIDGDTVYEGTELTYTYSPAPGRHTVAVYVNGVMREFSDGNTALDVYIVGSITPTAPTFDFDNLYPHAYVRFSAEGNAQVEITSPSGSVTEYAQTDPRYSDLFGNDGFDAGGLISLCADGITSRVYKFRVKSLGDGGALGPSSYSPYTLFTQLPSSADEYIKSRYLDRDLYITSDEEYAHALEYYILFRSKTGVPKVSFKCYMAYSLTRSEEDLFDDAFSWVATSGSYRNIDVSMNNSVMTTSFSVSTVNNPSRQSKTSGNTSQYAKQLHAIIPHINYDRNKDRPDDYVFPIDGLENTQTVKYGDELFFAVQNNTRPIVSVGTPAYILYNTARSILRQICTDEMTDREKAHAIYDWIMWQVTYDTPATEAYSNGESYSAYYLEGVFGNGSTKIGGVAYAPYAVCDGMSKAYSLMCNIEGIPCVRVAGDAGESMAEDDRGGHAWNKVCIDGDWYVVDCTWGDSQSELSIGNAPRAEYELGLHDYLFLTDVQADPTHFEPYELGDSQMLYVPETTTRRYNVYADMTYNGTPINCAITMSQNILTRVREIATAFASSYVKRSTIYVPGGPNNGEYAISYEGLDIFVDGDLDVSDNAVNSAVKSAVRSVYPTADVQVKIYDNIILILMKA